jgi:Fructose-bisphosphate aldolase class-I.
MLSSIKIAGVNLKGIVLKPNMILNGSESGITNETSEVAAKTLKCLTNNVPKKFLALHSFLAVKAN